MATFETFYDINPVSIIDQNQWDEKIPEVALQFRQAPVMYTPMIDWDDTTQRTGAATTIFTELLEGDVDVSEIPLTANYIDSPHTPDSRQRALSTTRYGDKVQLHESSNIFQQWKMSGGRDWRPLLRGLLGRNVINKFEMLARNSFLLQPSEFYTYADGGAGPADIGDLAATDTFNFGIINEWNLRLGNTGTPVVPGESAAIKLAIIPPGVVYDFQESLAAASANEQSMWRDTQIYSGQALRYEIGAYKGVRFLQHPNDRYGMNNAVLYNFGAIDKQYGVTQQINSGDGAPDPETTSVDGVWQVGQKGVVHYIQLESFSEDDYEVNDIVTIHVQRSAAFGVTNGVLPTAGKVIYRRVVDSDHTNNRLSFDRPIMFRYDVPFNAASETGAADGIMYAFVTKGRHVAMTLVLGSRGGIMGEVARPLKFYEPRPIDDFESVWRYVWDIVAGYNIWDPHLYELHFSAVSLPKIGGVITP